MLKNDGESSSPEKGADSSTDKYSPTNPNVPGGDADDEGMHEMTASYSEISFDPQRTPLVEASGKIVERPDHLDLVDSNEQYVEDLDGTVTKEGDMVNFVAEDLELKIKLASPTAKGADGPLYYGSPSSLPSAYGRSSLPQLPSLDPNVLNDLEAEARRVASSVDTLTESLAGVLRSVSALTVDCLEIYRDAVCKTCDAVDSNIKAMYQLMAKCEELSKTMKPLYRLSDDIKEMRRLLDLFENAVNS